MVPIKYQINTNIYQYSVRVLDDPKSKSHMVSITKKLISCILYIMM